MYGYLMKIWTSFCQCINKFQASSNNFAKITPFEIVLQYEYLVLNSIQKINVHKQTMFK